MTDQGDEPATTTVGADQHRLPAILHTLHQPVLACVGGTCDAATLDVLAACDIVFGADDAQFLLPDQTLIDAPEAERRGLVTLCFPAAALQRETDALARELAAKDPLALRWTKRTVREVDAVPWDAIVDFNAALANELKEAHAGAPSARAAGIQSFLAGKSKPGLGR